MSPSSLHFAAIRELGFASNILLGGNLQDNQITGWIDDSYNLVAAGLNKKEKTELLKLQNK